jgi:acylphosphatase
METPMSRARRYTVRGRVQGVGFRYFVQQAGSALGLGGWVRNRSDGSVEAHAEGDEPTLARFREALEKGPPLSRVDDVHEAPAPLSGDEVFRITS